MGTAPRHPGETLSLTAGAGAGVAAPRVRVDRRVPGWDSHQCQWQYPGLFQITAPPLDLIILWMCIILWYGRGAKYLPDTIHGTWPAIFPPPLLLGLLVDWSCSVPGHRFPIPLADLPPTKAAPQRCLGPSFQRTSKSQNPTKCSQPERTLLQNRTQLTASLSSWAPSLSAQQRATAAAPPPIPWGCVPIVYSWVVLDL